MVSPRSPLMPFPFPVDSVDIVAHKQSLGQLQPGALPSFPTSRNQCWTESLRSDLLSIECCASRSLRVVSQFKYYTGELVPRQSCCVYATAFNFVNASPIACIGMSSNASCMMSPSLTTSASFLTRAF